MRFVDTQTISLKEVPDSEVHSLQKGYAILSHRWLDVEVTFDDVLSQRHLNPSQSLEKLQSACNLACSLDYDLLWIDTCCIDKRSSTELSETINSMYRWYSDAKICIAYLPDVLSIEDLGTSVWFNRGWTLQELLAPKDVSFYNTRWQYLGSKHDLAASLSTITRIPIEVLTGAAKPHTYSVAQRMSWAASRTTTRIEDMAYSLLGLFNVNMAMIYGEREQAFIRLQEEIIKKSADQSVFAWNLSPEQGSSGLLAPSVGAFRDCDDIHGTNASQGFSIGNTGLSINLLIGWFSPGIYVAALGAARSEQYQIGIFLTQTKRIGQYARICDFAGHGLVSVKPYFSLKLQTIHVRQETDEDPDILYPGFWLRQLQCPFCTVHKPVIISRDVTPHPDRIRLLDGVCGAAGMIWISSKTTQYETRKTTWFCGRWLVFGFDRDSNPICLMSTSGSVEEPPTQSLHQDILKVLKWPPGHPKAYFSAQYVETILRSDLGIPPRPHVWPGGGIMLKGNRKDGISWSVGASNLNIKIKRCPDLGMTMEDSSPDSQVRHVWAVDITAIKNESHEPPPQRSLFRYCGSC